MGEGPRTNLIGQLQRKLRSVGTECIPDDLAQGLDDAVQAYSEVRPRLSQLTISWSAGQGVIDLPADLIRMEPASWAALTQPAPQNIAMYDGRGYGYRTGLAQNLRPVMPSAPPATYTIYPGYPPQLVIEPAPVSAGSMDTRCYRSHVISDTDGETTIPMPDWRLIVLEGVYQVYRAVVRERGIRPIQFEAQGDNNTQRIRMADPDALAKLAEGDHAEFLRRLGIGGGKA